MCKLPSKLSALCNLCFTFRSHFFLIFLVPSLDYTLLLSVYLQIFF